MGESVPYNILCKMPDNKHLSMANYTDAQIKLALAQNRIYKAGSVDVKNQFFVTYKNILSSLNTIVRAHCNVCGKNISVNKNTPITAESAKSIWQFINQLRQLGGLDVLPTPIDRYKEKQKQIGLTLPVSKPVQMSMALTIPIFDRSLRDNQPVNTKHMQNNFLGDQQTTFTNISPFQCVICIVPMDIDNHDYDYDYECEKMVLD